MIDTETPLVDQEQHYILTWPMHVKWEKLSTGYGHVGLLCPTALNISHASNGRACLIVRDRVAGSLPQ